MRNAVARSDQDRLAAELAARRLLSLIGTRALEAAPGACTDRFRERVAAARTIARARGMAVEGFTLRTVALLERAGIVALPLKGPLLATAVHGDLGLRETDDVDLLVPRDRLEEAKALLIEDGYRAPADPVRRNGLPDLHYALDHPERPSVELHWRVHFPEEDFGQAMLRRATAGPDGLLRPRPEDLAASLLLFYARDGFNGLRLPADIAAWWDAFGEQVEPGFLEPIALEHPGMAPALTAAAIATGRLTGAPALAWLGRAAAAGRRVRLAARLADWTATADRDQLAANISLVDGLLAPAGGRVAFAVRELVPREGPALPHAAKMVGRYAVGIWQVRGGRAWSANPDVGLRRRIELMGMPLDPVTEAEAVGHVTESLGAGRGGWVMTPNLDQLRRYVHDPALRGLFHEANLIVADGMPLLWASRLAGTPLPARVAGSDVIWSLTAEAAFNGRSIFLLGGAPGVCHRAGDQLHANYPGLRIVGCHSPPFGFERDQHELDEIRARLREAQPDIVYVALGFPKQERLIQLVRGELPEAWYVGVGISFSFLAGDVKRAPDWVQRIGLEWGHRLLHEPRRLAPRYLRDLPFAARLALHSAVRRVVPAAKPQPYSPVRPGFTRVVFTHGAVERRRAEDLAALRAGLP